MSKNHQTEIFTVLYRVSFNLFYATPAQKSSFLLKENGHSLERQETNRPLNFDLDNLIRQILYRVYKKVNLGNSNYLQFVALIRRI